MVQRLKRFTAFTLAEVLITLGIIGVVAAITIPTLMNYHQNKVLETRYKKAYSTLANGYKMMLVNNDVMSLENLPFVADFTNTNLISSAHQKVFQIVNDNVSAGTLPESYLLSSSNEEASFKWSDVVYIFQGSDGVTYGVAQNAERANTLDVVVDVNASLAPNKVNKDLFKFSVSNDGTVSDFSTELDNNGIEVCSGYDCKTEEGCLAAREYESQFCWREQSDGSYVCTELECWNVH